VVRTVGVDIIANIRKTLQATAFAIRHAG
jgi:hypothetical protein